MAMTDTMMMIDDKMTIDLLIVVNVKCAIFFERFPAVCPNYKALLFKSIDIIDQFIEKCLIRYS